MLNANVWTRRAVLSGTGGFLLSSFIHPIKAEPSSAEEIALRSSQVDMVPSWDAGCRMLLRGPNSSDRTRTGRISNLRREDGSNMMRRYLFNAPADLRGTALLIHENRDNDDDIWIHLPAVAKTRRIVSGDLKNSFLGTEFSFVDLMTQRVGKFRHSLLGEALIDGVRCHVLEAIPKSRDWAGDIGYSRQRIWCRQDTLASVQVEYDDLKGRPLKRQILGNFHSAEGGRFIARFRQMTSLQTGRATEIVLDGVRVNAGLSPYDFLPGRLSR